MSNANDELRDTAERLARRAAQRYWDAATQYGQKLSELSQGNAKLADVARTGAELAIEEARDLVETGVALTEAYYRWVLALAGVRPAERAPVGPAEPAPGGT